MSKYKTKIRHTSELYIDLDKILQYLILINGEFQIPKEQWHLRPHDEQVANL